VGQMDRDRLPHITVKCRPRAKRGIGSISKKFRLVTRPNPCCCCWWWW